MLGYPRTTELIREADLSQAETARRIGLTPSGLCHKLRGRRQLLANEAVALADCLSAELRRVVSLDELLGRKVEKRFVKQLANGDESPRAARGRRNEGKVAA